MPIDILSLLRTIALCSSCALSIDLFSIKNIVNARNQRGHELTIILNLDAKSWSLISCYLDEEVSFDN